MHALDRMRERCITVSQVEAVIARPEQVLAEEGLTVFQARLEEGGRTYLYRISVNASVSPLLVVTA